jgi:hypothetical protein
MNPSSATDDGRRATRIRMAVGVALVAASLAVIVLYEMRVLFHGASADP